MTVMARNLTWLLVAALMSAGAGCTAPQSSFGETAPDNPQASVAGDTAAKRFQNTPPGGRTAVESAIELSQKYANLSDQTVILREENQRLKTENENLQEQVAGLEARLKQTQKELSEANDLLIEMLTELNTWKNNILGFRGEMRDAAKAQLEALLRSDDPLSRGEGARTIGYLGEPEFAPLLLPVGAFLLHLWRTRGGSQGLKRGLLAALGILVGLWALSLLFGGLQVFVGNLLQASGGSSLLQEFGAPDWPSLLRESILRRLAAPGGWITLTLLLAGTLGLVLGSRGAREQGSAGDTNPYLTPSHPGTPALFVLLLILLGALLVLGADFFYLRDQFGSRFNTIFKFYYTAWMLWGIAAAYSSAFLLSALRGAWGTVFRAGLVALIGAGLVYAYFGLREKTNNFNPPDGWTLDGGAYLARWAPEDLAAIRWLQTAPAGVIVEAVHPQGGQYTEFARISTYSGLPTVLGWVGHESQWRGSDESFRGRQADIELFYTTRDWNQAQAILHKYGIRYVILGQRERSVYRVSETKFEHSLTPVFRQGSLVIYEVP